MYINHTHPLNPLTLSYTRFVTVWENLKGVCMRKPSPRGLLKNILEYLENHNLDDALIRDIIISDIKECLERTKYKSTKSNEERRQKYQENKSDINARRRTWRREHADEINEARRKRYASDTDFREKDAIRRKRNR
jgi:hypothetical protein